MPRKAIHNEPSAWVLAECQRQASEQEQASPNAPPPAERSTAIIMARTQDKAVSVSIPERI